MATGQVNPFQVGIAASTNYIASDDVSLPTILPSVSTSPTSIPPPPWKPAVEPEQSSSLFHGTTEAALTTAEMTLNKRRKVLSTFDTPRVVAKKAPAADTRDLTVGWKIFNKEEYKNCKVDDESNVQHSTRKNLPIHGRLTGLRKCVQRWPECPHVQKLKEIVVKDMAELDLSVQDETVLSSPWCAAKQWM